ncbi:MAG: rRNA adenine N(6)-methyltransferase family protein [Nocardioidaceae bacterium]
MSAGSDRRWGWHRLEPEWAERVVAAAHVRPGDLVLDLGAGTGALTAPLVRRGARVVAVELHAGRADRLRARFAGLPVRVVCADLLAFKLPDRVFRVVANPPYALTTPLLRMLLAPGSRLRAADLILQRAVVSHWVASDRRSVPRRGGWDAEMGMRLPRRAFSPRPPVDSAVLVLRRR